MVDCIEVKGSHRKIGEEIGKSLISKPELFQDFLDFMDRQIQEAKSAVRDSDFNNFRKEFVSILNEYSPSTIRWIEGLSSSLEVPRQKLFALHISAYFIDLKKINTEDLEHKEGNCSTFALKDSNEGPVLAKNRDNKEDFLSLQTVNKLYPEKGYSYLSVSTYGFAGVHSSGINEKGLAVADTHVYSRANDMGLPRFVLEKEILESCNSVAEALNLLKKLPAMGRGSIILVDSARELAVVELSATEKSLRQTSNEFIVNTNHFVTKALKTQFVELEDSDTFARYGRIMSFLGQNQPYSLNDVEKIVSMHKHGLGSICKHKKKKCKWRTISSSIFLPLNKTLLFREGYPCEDRLKMFSLLA